MSRRPREDESTVPFKTQSAGNDLYHRALFAIGKHSSAVATILESTMRAIGASPATLSLDELGAMLPEIERRLRLLAPPDEAGASMGRLRRLMFAWDEP
jgi:hypothetical protein